MWPVCWVPQSTAVRQGTDVLHVPKQTHFGQDTVSDEMFLIPVVGESASSACRHGLKDVLKPEAYWPHMPGTGRKEIVSCQWLIGKDMTTFCTP